MIILDFLLSQASLEYQKIYIPPRNCGTQFFRKFLLYFLSQVQIERQQLRLIFCKRQRGVQALLPRILPIFIHVYLYQINLTCWVTSWILALTLYPTELHCRSAQCTLYSLRVKPFHRKSFSHQQNIMQSQSRSNIFKRKT